MQMIVQMRAAYSTTEHMCLRAAGPFQPRPPMGPPPGQPYRAPRVQYWKDGEFHGIECPNAWQKWLF